METAFYEMYRLLCQKKGKSDNAVASEIGLSNSTVTTWRQGTIPRRQTIKKVADYFGVEPGYLMGNTIEAQIDLAEKNISDVRASINQSSDESERAELTSQLEVLQESYRDLCFAKNLKKKAPTSTGERIPYKEKREFLAGQGIRILLDTDAKLTEDQLDDILEFIKFQQGKNGR